MVWISFFSALDNPNLSYFITDLIVAITPSFKRCFGALCTKKLSKDISIDCGSQGCISCGILLSGTGARGVSSEHMENVEMFSENCALVWLSENRDLVLGEPCSGPQRKASLHLLMFK